MVVSLPESIVRDKYHHYNQLMANNFKTWQDGPNFDSKLPQNVTAIHGKSTQLVCRVIDLGNKTVRNTRKYTQRYSNKHNDTLRNIPIKCKAWILRGEAFTCLRQFLTYHAATITLATILGLR